MKHDATIVLNTSLREFLKCHRDTLRSYYLSVYREHKKVPVGTQNDNGLKHGSFSLGLNANTHPLIQQVLSAIATQLTGYDLYTPELFFGVGKPVRLHNDVSLFLRAGQEVPIQLWILLEACILGSTGITETRRRNALLVGSPAAPGPVYAGTSYALTPQGRVALKFDQIVGGDELENGDVLLFKNGCVHFTRAVRQRGLFRVALAVRAIRRERSEDDNYLRWMKQLWATDAELVREARGAYISSAQRMLLDCVDDQPADMAKLLKLDANDYGAVIAALGKFDPSLAKATLVDYLELRSQDSLKR